MTQSEFQALERILDHLTLQAASISAEVTQLKTGQALIEQRLDSEKASALREAALLKQLADMGAEHKAAMAEKIIEIKESDFTFHLRVLTGIVLFLAFASFPQLYHLWKAFKP